MISASRTRPFVIAATLLLLGCGGGGGPIEVSGTGGTTGSAGRAGLGGAGGGAPGTAGGGAAGTAGGAGGAPTAFVVTAPSFSVAPNSESVQCVVVDLGNARAIHVGQIKTTLSPFVYEVRIGATTWDLEATPFECAPYVDINHKDVRPLVFARNATDDLVFPTGVGYTLAAHQRLRIEVHAFNGTAAAVSASASATFTTMPDAAFQQEAGLFVFEEMTIDIPAQSTASVGPVFFPLSTAIGGASLFRITGYTHKLGVGLTMSTATSADAPPTTIYSPAWDFASPVVVNKMPPVVLPSPGGINLTCSWDNTGGASPVVYRDYLYGEHCAGVLYYYPATTVHHCVHVLDGGVGSFVCCPGASSCPQG